VMANYIKCLYIQTPICDVKFTSSLKFREIKSLLVKEVEENKNAGNIFINTKKILSTIEYH
jgi:hypothetical protein